VRGHTSAYQCVLTVTNEFHLGIPFDVAIAADRALHVRRFHVNALVL